jgi:formylglycine-generating enzyme required for sulfatase activity
MSQLSIPHERFPPRLAQLGYQGPVLNRVEVILPPHCDVPAGELLMGSDPSLDKQTLDIERSQLWVTLPAFQIACFPVTVAEYACFVRARQKLPANWWAN